jgi:ribose 5-phosphate isomerase B
VKLGSNDIVTPAAVDLARTLGVPLEGDSLTSTPDRGTRPVVAVGADHGGYRLKEALKAVVAEAGFAVRDLGCDSAEPVDYPVFAARVADQVASGAARFGIMVDGAGIGSAMVANKIAGVRAAPCHDVTTAKNAREHNDANLLTLGGGLIGERLAVDIVRVFLGTPFGGDRHARRVAMIDALDRERGAGSREL